MRRKRKRDFASCSKNRKIRFTLLNKKEVQVCRLKPVKTMHGVHKKNIFHIILNNCTNFGRVIVFILGVLVEIMDRHFTHCLFVVFFPSRRTKNTA